MTEFNDDKPETQNEKSFKEQILAELEEANRLRDQREKELYQKELEAKEAALKTAQLKAQYEAQKRQDKQDAAIQAEKMRLEQEAQEALAQNHIDTTVDKAEINQVLKDLDQAFKFIPDSHKSESQEPAIDDEDSFVVRAVDGVGSAGIPEIEDAPAESLTPIGDFGEESVSEAIAEESSNQDTKETVPPAAKIAGDEEAKEEKQEVSGNRGNHRSHRRRRQKTDSLAKRIARILIAAIVIVLLATGFFTYRYVSSALGALDSTSTEYVTVEIPEGSSNKYIGQILEEAGVIKSATVFNYYTKFKNYSNLQSGYYNFQASMTVEEICQQLQEGGTAEPEEPTLGKILVTEGYTIKQIAEAVTTNSAADDDDDSSTPFTAEDFLAVVQDEAFIAEMVEKYPTLLADIPSAEDAVYRLEGYLFPATYSYHEDTTIRSLVEEMIATMDAYLSDYYDTISSNGYTVNEILTLASLVEKEGSTDDDRRNIASVFYNRLNAGMALQSNIAVLYAMGTLGEETTLEEDANVDTSIDSLYNDYLYTGLMPGPVDSPSLSAIEATINPASTNYYYFVADVKTGAVYFAETYEEHEQNVEEYVNSQISD